MIRLKREQYAVGEAYRGAVEVTVGIYYETPITEDVAALADVAQDLGHAALQTWGGNHVAVAGDVQKELERRYPDRPFYVETREDGRGVQVYQPYGMPQESNYGEGGVGEGSQVQVP